MPSEPVAALVDLDDGARLGAVDRLLGHRLVQLGVERLALGREGLDARRARARRRARRCTSRMPSASVVVAVLGRPASARSRLSSAGSSSLASLRDAALLGRPRPRARRACGSSRSRPACAARARGTRRARRWPARRARSSVASARRAPAPRHGRRRGRSARRRARCLGCGEPRPLLVDRALASAISVTCPRRRPRRRRRPPRPSRRRRRRRRRRRTRAVGLRACCWARSYIASETLWNAVCSASVLALIVAGVLGRQRLADLLDRGLDLAPWTRSSTWSPSSLSWRSAW